MIQIDYYGCMFCNKVCARHKKGLITKVDWKKYMDEKSKGTDIEKGGTNKLYNLATSRE